ncbi:DEAD/DEAH box helicase, partial [bacterium]
LDQFEKQVVIPKRTELIAKTILEQINPMDKTIIFCVNQKHAIDMKIAIDKHKIVKDNHYCVRVTSDEGQLGRDFLEAFQNNDRDIPTILTSSKMLTTGVDAKSVRNVVLTAPIRSMTEFKQIIGRGTRVFEGKDFFTIIDFVGATNLFYDDAWDGLPEEQVDEITTEIIEVIEEPKKGYGKKEKREEDTKTTGGPKEKVTIDIKGRKLKVINIETTYVGEDGIPLKTHEFLEFLVGILDKFFHDEDQLREIWSDPVKREELLEKLRVMQIDEVQLDELKSIFEAEESDIYDVLAHLSFNLEIQTRSERAFAVYYRKYIEKYHNDKVKEFLTFILNRYEKDGVKEMGSDKLSTLIKLSGIDRNELKEAFEGAVNIREGYFGLQREIYR